MRDFIVVYEHMVGQKIHRATTTIHSKTAEEAKDIFNMVAFDTIKGAKVIRINELWEGR